MDEIFLEKIKELGVHEYGIIPTEQVPFEHEVREMCAANRCGIYGKKWCCPPGCGTEEECREKCMKFKNVLVFSTKTDLEDSFDFEGMTAAMVRHREVSKKVRSLFRETYGDDFLALSSEGCDNCKECTYPDAPCRFPNDMMPSVESHGIMVYKEAAACGIHYINGANTVTFFSNIFFN